MMYNKNHHNIFTYIYIYRRIGSTTKLIINLIQLGTFPGPFVFSAHRFFRLQRHKAKQNGLYFHYRSHFPL